MSDYLQNNRYRKTGEEDLTNRSIFNYVLQDAPRQGSLDVSYLSKHVNLNPGSRGEPVGDRLDIDMTHGRSKRESSGQQRQPWDFQFPGTEARTDFERIPFESKQRGEGRAVGAESSFSRFIPLVPNMAAFIENDVPLDAHTIGTSARVKG